MAGKGIVNDDATITLTCPRCGQKFPKTVGELKREAEFLCPHCGATFENERGAADFKSVEDSLREFGRGLSGKRKF